MYDDDTQNIYVEGNEGYQKTKNYLKLMMPNQIKKVKKYRDKIPLFYKENIEKKLFEIFETEVKLTSGGYLVINPTEALVSIDVNSGKSIKQKNVESTAFDTNIEAAEEIARQIKIRDLSGLIIIDFIDMLNFNNRRQVERKLKEKCRNDRARIQIGRISNFGLLEMSRQRLRESNIKWHMKLTDETFVLKVLKLIEIKSLEQNAKIVELTINDKIKKHITEHYEEVVKYFQKKHKAKIELKINNDLNLEDYIIEFKSKTKKVLDKIEKVEKLEVIKIDNSKDENIIKNKSRKIYKKRKFRKKFYKKITK